MDRWPSGGTTFSVMGLLDSGAALQSLVEGVCDLVSVWEDRFAWIRVSACGE